MMKYLLMVSMVFFSVKVFAQEPVKFKEGAFLIANELSEEVKKANTILFVFHGEFDVYPPNATIEKYLKKRFKKSKFKVDFVYWDNKKKELTNPNIKTSDYDIACLLAFDYGKNLNGHEDERRQLLSHWNIVCEKGDTAENLGYAKIDVYCSRYLFMEDVATSKMIFNLFSN
jgi:hypothetical protein